MRRRTTERAVSRMGSPNETTGMATATMVGDFCMPCSASALSMKPTNRLPQSPRKMVAGLKLKRRKPRIAPASTSVITDTNEEWLNSATTKTTRVENNAEPAASPSSPSIRLKALVMPRTHRIVSGSLTNQGKWYPLNRTGRSRMRSPPANKMAPASTCTRELEVRAPPDAGRRTGPAEKSESRAARMVSSAFDENPKLRRGCHQLTSPAIPMLNRNARKMATPPRRGSGRLCKCRSRPGPATQPRTVARSRMYRVRTNEASTEAANIPR